MRLMLIIAAAALACVPTRNLIHNVTPTAPPDEGATCPPIPWRCRDLVPQRCVVSDSVARWYPQHPLSTAGRPAACAVRCVVEATAHCAGAEVTL